MSAPGDTAHTPGVEQGFQLDGIVVEPSTGVVTGPGGREQLDPKVMDVLVYLARHAGQVVLREDLMTRLWPKVVVTDDALTRCIHELRKHLSQAGGSERYRAMLETLPKRGYRLNGDVTPRQFPSRETRSPMRSLGSKRRRLMAGLAVGVAVVAVIAMAPRVEQPPVQPHPLTSQGTKPSIAVLPFVDMSAAQDQGYLADGMAEEILNLLGRIPQLRVISRNSAFVYKGRNVDVTEIGGRLKVTHVLEGSVRKSGDRIRITTQLIDARSDTHLWSETYDRTLDDLFEVQDDIAAKVVAQLRLQLVQALPKSRRLDPQAYLSYVQARQRLEDPQADQAATYALLQHALALEPTYGQAWTGLSWLYFVCEQVNETETSERFPAEQRDKFCSHHGNEELVDLRRKALKKALELEPDNATALAYRALDEPDFRATAVSLERAARLDPTNVDVLRLVMHFTIDIRRPDLTIRIGEFVAERDPSCAACLDQLARAYEATNRLDEGEAAARVYHRSPHILARILLEKGEAQAALEVARSSELGLNEADRAWALHLEAMALHSLGRPQESAAALAQLETKFGARYAHLVSPTYAWKGDMENAVLWLERHFAANGGPNLRQLTNPILQPVLRDPRIHALLRQRSLAPEQLAQIHFELTLPAGEVTTAFAR